jgi:hypothetical protein
MHEGKDCTSLIAMLKEKTYFLGPATSTRWLFVNNDDSMWFYIYITGRTPYVTKLGPHAVVYFL